jgi:uncharacterized protein (DUF433 family)
MDVDVDLAYPHLTRDDSGNPSITGTTMKIVELVAEHLAHGWSPEELRFQHPYLTLGQVHSALAYYWDHRQELDRELLQRLDLADQVADSQSPPVWLDRLRSARQPSV